MKIEDLNDVERVEVKLDLIFGMLSNQVFASQAIEAYQAVAGQEDEQSKEVAQKSADAFKHHNKNLIDSVDYYINLFGQAANDKLVGILKAKGYKEAPEGDTPEPVTDVQTSGSRKSVKVEDSGE